MEELCHGMIILNCDRAEDSDTDYIAHFVIIVSLHFIH